MGAAMLLLVGLGGPSELHPDAPDPADLQALLNATLCKPVPFAVSPAQRKLAVRRSRRRSQAAEHKEWAEGEAP